MATVLAALPHCPSPVQLSLSGCRGPLSLLVRAWLCLPRCHPWLSALVEQMVPGKGRRKNKTAFEPERDVSCISITNLPGGCTRLPIPWLLLCFLSEMPCLKCSEQWLSCPPLPTFFHETNEQPARKQDSLVDSFRICSCLSGGGRWGNP